MMILREFSAVNLIILLEKLCHRKYRVPSQAKSKSERFRRFFLCVSKINKTWKLFLDLELILGSRLVRQKLCLSLNAKSGQCVKNIWIVWFWGLCNFEDLQLLPMSEKLLLPTQLLLLNAQRHSSFSHCLRSSLLELGGLVVKKQILREAVWTEMELQCV